MNLSFLDDLFDIISPFMFWQEFLAAFIESGIALWFCSRYLGFKNNKVRWLKFGAFFVVLSIPALYCYRFNNATAFRIFAFWLICLIYCHLFLNGKFTEKLFATFVPALVYVPINRIFAKFFSLTADKGEASKFVLFFSLFGFFLVCSLVLKLCKKPFSLTTPQWILQFSCFGISVLISSILRKLSLWETLYDRDFLIIFILIAALNVLLFIFMLMMQRYAEEKAVETALRTELNNKKNNVSDSESRYQEIRILRHDMKHYVTTAIELISEDQPQKAREYLETILNEKLNPVYGGVSTGNSVIDAVLTEKQKLCGAKGVELKMQLDRELGDISEIDIGVIIANLFDNAVKGCGGADKPQIMLSIKRVKAYLRIEIKNTVKSSVLEQNPELSTTNPDRDNHGLGISSVKSLAQKYDGSVSFSEDGDFFLAVVILKADCQPR